MPIFAKAMAWTLLALPIVLVSPSAMAFRMNLRFAMSLDSLALPGTNSSIQLVGYQPLCEGGGEYEDLPAPMRLMPGTSTVSPDLDMGIDVEVGPDVSGGIFCLIFELEQPGRPVATIRMYFNYALQMAQASRSFVIHEVSPRLNGNNGVAPRFVFGAPVDHLPYAGIFADENHIEFPLPIIRIVPRVPFGVISNFQLLSQ
ncbi:hypothetical protein [Dyella choica]|uniref:Uncharacterized protein n=1 Tax=Dyella choica TaxID=1927959 RepID=A0A3S0PG85_9GAMM|nr:hypothetical protein [Dyella choica]RUL71465.1 hypothetical protein EKH80_18950 [Dyella choica]